MNDFFLFSPRETLGLAPFPYEERLWIWNIFTTSTQSVPFQIAPFPYVVGEEFSCLRFSGNYYCGALSSNFGGRPPEKIGEQSGILVHITSSCRHSYSQVSGWLANKFGSHLLGMPRVSKYSNGKAFCLKCLLARLNSCIMGKMIIHCLLLLPLLFYSSEDSEENLLFQSEGEKSSTDLRYKNRSYDIYVGQILNVIIHGIFAGRCILCRYRISSSN